MEDEERRARVDSAESNDKKRVRDETGESDIDSVEVKRLRDDLLGGLDDSDPDPASHDLDSVMKSFEYELSASSLTSTKVQGSRETQPELGYLLEASDDELGLPPAPTPPPPQEEAVNELVRALSDSSEIDEFWGFENQTPNYKSFEFGVSDGYGGSFASVDGLYEFSDLSFDSGDLSSWRPETLPAK